MSQAFYTLNGRTMTGEQVLMFAMTEQDRAEAAERERDELAAQLATAQNALKAIIEASTYIDDGVNDAGDKQISRLYAIAANAMPANQVQP